MSERTYTLINPQVQGELPTTLEAKSPEKAMKKIWGNMSEYFSTDYPIHAFFMTIYNNDDNELHHFKVEDQKKRDDGGVMFHITKLDHDDESKDLKTASKKLLECYDKQQSGGNDSDSESSSSSDEDEEYIMGKGDSVKSIAGSKEFLLLRGFAAMVGLFCVLILLLYSSIKSCLWFIV